MCGRTLMKWLSVIGEHGGEFKEVAIGRSRRTVVASSGIYRAWVTVLTRDLADTIPTSRLPFCAFVTLKWNKGPVGCSESEVCWRIAAGEWRWGMASSRGACKCAGSFSASTECRGVGRRDLSRLPGLVSELTGSRAINAVEGDRVWVPRSISHPVGSGTASHCRQVQVRCRCLRRLLCWQ